MCCHLEFLFFILMNNCTQAPAFCRTFTYAHFKKGNLSANFINYYVNKCSRCVCVCVYPPVDNSPLVEIVEGEGDLCRVEPTTHKIKR